jgi:hypothetical protein
LSKRRRAQIAALTDGKRWSAPFWILRSEVFLGVALFALIVGIIVFGPTQSYRFFYGPQF